MNVILGMSAATGTGIGRAFVLPEVQKRIIPKTPISAEDVDTGWNRFQTACSVIGTQISSHLNTLSKDSLQRVIFETYQLMLSDPVFIKEVKDCYEQELFNIEHILEKKVFEYADRLRNSGNEYLAERSKDIEDVFGQVLDILLDYHPFNIEEVPDGSVIVGKAMSSSDTIILSKRKIAGLALTEGGTTSHMAILARSFGIPAVVGLDNVTEQVKQNDIVIVDGELGEIIVSPDADTIQSYRKRMEDEKLQRIELAKLRDTEARTKDGTRFCLYANIGTVEEAKIALDEGADGIGLFRTEFLFMNAIRQLNESGGAYSNSVGEETQFEAYKSVLEIMGNRPVTIRTLDAGGDKLVDVKDIPQMHEANPLMGLRAIRLSLYYPHVLRTQLRALYRASVYGDLRILLPLITDISQVETIKGIAKGVQLQLKEDNIPFREVPIGVMIETAAAAVTSDCLAKTSDFFSLGTNDLTQYTLGVDRENPAVAPIYNEFNLAVIRLIQFTIHNARHRDVPVSVCGEMAGKPESVMILSGMGIRNLSMSPKQIPLIKQTLSRFTIKELENIANRNIIQ